MLYAQINLQGGFHKAENQASQDAIATKVHKNVAAMCLCDGAGSYNNVRTGAQVTAHFMASMAVMKFRTALCNMNDEQLRNWFTANVAAVRQLLKARGNDYSCTVLLVAMDQFTGKTLVLHLGDGFIALRRKHGDFCQATFPPKFEGRAACLTSSPPAIIKEHLQIVRTFADDACVCSDGLEGCLYSRSGKISASLNAVADALGNYPRQMVQQQLQKTIQTQWQPLDDCGLAFMTRRHPAPDALAACMSSHPWKPAVRKQARAVIRHCELCNQGMDARCAALRVSGRRGAAKLVLRSRAYGV